MTSTFAAGLRADAVVAPFVMGGAMDGPTFRAYVAQVLAPNCARATLWSWTTCRRTIQSFADGCVHASPAARRYVKLINGFDVHS